MTRPHRLLPLVATAGLLALAGVFAALAAVPEAQPAHLVGVAASAGGLWLAAAAWTARPLLAYLIQRRRFRVALHSE